MGYVNSLEGNSSCLGYPVTRYQGTNPSPSPLFGRPHQHQPRPHVTRLMSPETSEEGPSPRVFTGIWDCNNKCLQLGFPGFGLHKIPKKNKDLQVTFLLGGGNSNIFWNVHRYLGKWSNLTSIFQMGCNHQPVFFLGKGEDCLHQKVSIPRITKSNSRSLQYLSHHERSLESILNVQRKATRCCKMMLKWMVCEVLRYFFPLRKATLDWCCWRIHRLLGYRSFKLVLFFGIIDKGTCCHEIF